MTTMTFWLRELEEGGRTEARFDALVTAASRRGEMLYIEDLMARWACVESGCGACEIAPGQIASDE